MVGSVPESIGTWLRIGIEMLVGFIHFKHYCYPPPDDAIHSFLAKTERHRRQMGKETVDRTELIDDVRFGHVSTILYF